MLSVATEIRQLVHNLGTLDNLGVKVASVGGSVEAQRTVADVSNGLYNVMVKSASINVPGEMPHHQRMVIFMDKVASVLNQPAIPAEVRLKIASASAADEALTTVMQHTPDVVERAKLAEARSFGREFMLELLRGVL